MGVSKSYSDKYFEQYQKNSFEVLLSKIRKKYVLASLEQYPHANILEIGPGLEVIFPLCSSFKTYTVIEPSQKCCLHAQKLAQGKENIFILEGYFPEVLEQTSTRKNKAFDFIIVSSLLHEISQPESFLQTLNKKSSKETVIHINVPNAHSFHRLLAVQMGLIANVFEPSPMEIYFERYTRFDRKKLIYMLEQNGFHVLSLGTYFVKPFTHKQMNDIIKKNIIDQKVIEGLDKMIEYMPDIGCELYVNICKK